MRKHLEILNFIGSVCSIAALLIVVFGELSWVKGLFIIIAIVMALSLTSANACWAIPLFRRINHTNNPYINICGIIGGAIIAVIMTGLFFWGTFVLLKSTEHIITTLVESIQSVQ